MCNPKAVFAVLFDKSSKDNASLRRYRSILRGGASAVIAKGVSAIAAFLAVPLTLSHLGPERYGLWITLYSIIAWLSLADLGLTNGLMNALSEAFGKQRQDLAREYVSVAFWGLSLLAFVVGAILLTTSLWVDWTSVFQIKVVGLGAEFAMAVSIGVVLFMMSLPLTIVGRVYIAHQQGEIANAWAAVATLGGLLGLASVVLLGGTLPTLVVGFSGGQLLVSAASAIWLFARAMPELRLTLRVSKASYRRVFHVGTAFFVSQLATLMMFQSANIIISRYLGFEHVAPYQVTWMLFFYVTLPQQLIGANIWAAVGEAYARSDIDWIRTLFKRYMLLSMIFGVPFILLLTIFCESIVSHWAGPTAIPTPELVYWMAAWALLLIFMQPLVAVLGGTGRLRIYSLVNVFVAVAAVTGAVWTVTKYGSVGVIASIVLSSGIFGLTSSAYLVWRILRINTKILP